MVGALPARDAAEERERREGVVGVKGARRNTLLACIGACGQTSYFACENVGSIHITLQPHEIWEIYMCWCVQG